MAKALTDELKAQIIAAFELGASVTEVANRYNVSKSTASKYRDLVGSEQVRTRQEFNLGALIHQNLKEMTDAETKILRELTSAKRIEKEDSNSLRQTLGVIGERKDRIVGGLYTEDETD